MANDKNTSNTNQGRTGDATRSDQGRTVSDTNRSGQSGSTGRSADTDSDDPSQ